MKKVHPKFQEIWGIFGILTNGQEIWVGFESSGGQKHLKNDLTAPILTHRKQSWEIEVLEGQMTSKFKNSTWVRK